MKPAISVRGLSKRYTLGEGAPYRTLRESLTGAALAPFGRMDQLGPGGVDPNPRGGLGPLRGRGVNAR